MNEKEQRALDDKELRALIEKVRELEARILLEPEADEIMRTRKRIGELEQSHDRTEADYRKFFDQMVIDAKDA